MKENKTNRITFLLSDTEKYMLEKMVRLNNQTISEYVRDLILNDNSKYESIEDFFKVED